MSDNLNALLGLDRYDELLREADAERRAKLTRGPAFSVRMWLARALVRLAIALAPAGVPGSPFGLPFDPQVPVPDVCSPFDGLRRVFRYAEDDRGF